MNNILTTEEISYLRAYNSYLKAFKAYSEHPELFSTKEALDLITLGNRFSMSKVVDLMDKVKGYEDMKEFLQ